MFTINKSRNDSRRRAASWTLRQVLRFVGPTLAVLIGTTVAAQAAIPSSERAVLENIYAQTNGSGWDHHRSWNGPPGTECSWPDVTCDTEGTTVIGLDLSDKGLYGILPPLAGLTNLESFDIHQTASGGIGPYNELYGPIPALKSLKKLKTFIATNTFFSGDLPSLAGMSNLEHFQCTGCALNGRIGSLRGLTHLKYFAVSGLPLAGNLSGSIPSLAGLSQLQYFKAHGSFTGTLPDLSGLTQLQNFHVRGYRFTGGLPDLVGLPNLQLFSVRGFVKGHLGALSNLPSLQEFDVTGNLLTGSIPPLDQLTELRNFYVGGNQLSGSVPDLSGLINLQFFMIPYNRLSGSLPAPPQSLIDRASTEKYHGGLCPNLLASASNPPTATDMDWNTITKTTPWSQDCEPDPVWKTNMLVTSSLSPSLAGQTVTFTAVVYGMYPTGTVTFMAKSKQPDNNASTGLCDGVPLIDGVATCTTSDLVNNGSSVQILGYYSGDANNAPTNNLVNGEMYQQVQDIVAEKSTDDTAQVGQPVDLTLTYGNGKDDDTAHFNEGPRFGKPICSDVPVHKSRSGRFIAHCVTQFETVGPHVLTAATYATTAEPIIQYVTAASPFDADQFALTGPWYNPATSGQGLQFAVYPDLQGDGVATLVGGWFTFDDSGHQRWMPLQGDLSASHGATYDLKIGQNSGGNFNAGPVTTPASVIGSAELTFYDCGHAAMTYQFDDGRSGTIPYVRLDPSTACSSAVPATPPAQLPAHYNDVLHSLAWYDPATSGQGLYLDLVPAQKSFFASWFTYAPQGSEDTDVARQRWFTLQANDYTPGDLALYDVKIISTSGGVFNQPTPVDVKQVGTADVTFNSCTSMTLDYHFDKGEFSGLSGSISEQVIAANPACQQ